MTQLYRILSNVRIPSGATPVMKGSRHFVTYVEIPKLPLMFWPNGYPCHLVNIWLAETANRSTGRESAKTNATLITHLIRFCYTRDISFYDFSDAYFRTFTTELSEDTKKLLGGIEEKSRSKTQVHNIQLTSLYFLKWLQEKHPMHDHPPLIGVSAEQPRVTVEWRSSPKNTKFYIWHPLLVTKSPPINDKFAIPDTFIAKIRDEIFRRHLTSKLPARSKLKERNNVELFEANLKYLFSRRMFVINMMTNFGLRPEELYDMPLEENSNIIERLQVLLPTKKTRHSTLARRLKINLNLAVTLQSYFDDRVSYINFLSKTQIAIREPNRVLLGESGRTFNKESITKEFDRLCEGAGLINVKICLSMFRHRLITREVKAELILRFKTNPEFARELTPSLRDDVSRVVMRKTGHRNTKSIWTYVDEEYKLLTVGDDIQKFNSTKDDLEQTKNSLLDLWYRNQINGTTHNNEQIEDIRKTLKELEHRLYTIQTKKDL